MSKRKKRILTILVILVAIFVTLYLLLVNFLVSAALVPSFMRKLDDFSRITEESLAEQIHTEDIETNLAESLDETAAWLDSAPGEKWTLTSRDGYRLVAQKFDGAEGSHDWALILHGYTGWKEEMYPYAMEYAKDGYHCLVPDLRAQGESEGDFIGMGYTDSEDLLLWIDRILSVDPEARIILHGQSMGAAAALMTAAKAQDNPHISAVISDCSFTDAYTMFGDKLKAWFQLPAFPLIDTARLVLLARGGYDFSDASALDAVKENSQIPTLFIHGSEDALIPVTASEELYDNAICEKKLLIVDGAGHAQSQDKEPDLYWDSIRAWITTPR